MLAFCLNQQTRGKTELNIFTLTNASKTATSISITVD